FWGFLSAQCGFLLYRGIYMHPYIIQSIMDHAKAEYPNECCGLVIQNSRKQQYIRCRNTAPSPTEQFSIHPADYAEAEDISAGIYAEDQQ
ncbi:Mov34/MPN/PAD-1 family protein, partial [Xenorhabdus bovienii]|uniref:Mov34/MPN/PAD-1 family protein n=1 Tax=Xenorhabdus bovienii TaxID=40576 RepID=UPI0039BDDD4E